MVAESSLGSLRQDAVGAMRVGFGDGSRMDPRCHSAKTVESMTALCLSLFLIIIDCLKSGLRADLKRDGVKEGTLGAA